jgi:hypothetical protein
MNVAVGLAADGALVVIASGWTHRPRKGEGTAGHGGDARPLLPWVCRSTDGGRTWAREGAVSGAMQHPAHLLPLADRRILLTYGDRSGDNNPFFLGIGYRLSEDGGRTWSESAILQESGHRPGMQWPSSDGGYPASVQLADGNIVTAWYSSAAPGVHERYHMGAAVWTLPVKQTGKRTTAEHVSTNA